MGRFPGTFLPPDLYRSRVMASPTKITENRRAARSAKRVMKRNKKNNLKASKAKAAAK